MSKRAPNSEGFTQTVQLIAMVGPSLAQYALFIIRTFDVSLLKTHRANLHRCCYPPGDGKAAG